MTQFYRLLFQIVDRSINTLFKRLVKRLLIFQINKQINLELFYLYYNKQKIE
jgi:hypothetical protein